MARLVRCPVCLRPSRAPGPRGQLRCRGCRRPFNGSTALPFDAGRSVVTGGHADLLLNGGAAAVTACIVFFVVARMDWVSASTSSPSFLFGYVLLAVALRLLLALVRGFGLDTLVVTLSVLGVFVGIGLLRWLSTRNAGMQGYELLFVLMALGTGLFFLRLRHGGSGRVGRAGGASNATAGGCSSNSCGGCGSGGGCGGCGGGGD